MTNVMTYRSFEFPRCETPSFCPDPLPMIAGYNRWERRYAFMD